MTQIAYNNNLLYFIGLNFHLTQNNFIRCRPYVGLILRGFRPGTIISMCELKLSIGFNGSSKKSSYVRTMDIQSEKEIKSVAFKVWKWTHLLIVRSKAVIIDDGRIDQERLSMITPKFMWMDNPRSLFVSVQSRQLITNTCLVSPWNSPH